MGEGQSQQPYTNLEKATGRKCEHGKGLKKDVLQTKLNKSWVSFDVMMIRHVRLHQEIRRRVLQKRQRKCSTSARTLTKSARKLLKKFKTFNLLVVI